MKAYTLSQLNSAYLLTDRRSLEAAFKPIFKENADMIADRCHRIGLFKFIETSRHNPTHLAAIEAFIDSTITPTS